MNPLETANGIDKAETTFPPYTGDPHQQKPRWNQLPAVAIVPVASENDLQYPPPTPQKKDNQKINQSLPRTCPSKRTIMRLPLSRAEDNATSRMLQEGWLMVSLMVTIHSAISAWGFIKSGNYSRGGILIFWSGGSRSESLFGTGKSQVLVCIERGALVHVCVGNGSELFACIKPIEKIFVYTSIVN